MTTPNKESLSNANRMQSGQGKLVTSLEGRITGLPIYDLDFTKLNALIKVGKIINNNADNAGSMANEWCSNRRENHRDDNGNLPHVVAPQHAYCEFHITDNGAPYPAQIRIIYDTESDNIFVSPSHYDDWTDNDGTQRNPFYRIVNLPAYVFAGTPVYE